MFAARTSLPPARLDDICDVLEAIAVSLPGDRIAVEARVDRGGAGLQLHVSGLAGGTARSVLSDVRHGGLARLLAVTSDGVAVRSSTTPRRVTRRHVRPAAMTDRVVIASDTDEDVLVDGRAGRARPLQRPRAARPPARGDRRRRATSVVLDLRETTFMDSTALGVIVAAMKALRAQDGRLVLVNESRSIAKTLTITGLDELLAVERTLDAALAVARDGLAPRRLVAQHPLLHQREPEHVRDEAQRAQQPVADHRACRRTAARARASASPAQIAGTIRAPRPSGAPSAAASGGDRAR